MFIGSASYNNLTPLPGVTNNLDRLNTLFTSQAVWNLPSEHCTVLHEPTTTLEIVKAVRHAAQEAKGALFIYFAGHGLVDRDTGELHLGIPSSEVSDPHLTALPYDWVRREVLRSPAFHRIVVLDCCFSGRALGMMSEHSAKSAIDRAEIDRTYLMAAAAENSTAIAPEGDIYTSFTGELIHALTNGVDNDSPLVDLDTLHALIENGLNAKGYPSPQCRDRNQAGRTPFARNSAYTGRRNTLEPESASGHTPTSRDNNETDSPAKDLTQRLGCLDIDNPGTRKLEILVDGASVGGISAGRQARFHIATGSRSVRARSGDKYSESRRVEISTQSRVRISYAFAGGARIESSSRANFAADSSSWSLLGVFLMFAFVPVILLSLVFSDASTAEGPVHWLILTFAFWYGAVFFMGIQLRWLSGLNLSDTGVACIRFKRKEISWREVDWIGIREEGRAVDLVFWPHGTSRSNPPEPLGRLDNIAKKHELDEIRGALMWYAGDRYIEHP
ncbi:caspase domain-containing protein [Streptomyces sp. AJS327]|uniref:caspase family protein n=1 Tax=Streptomyces sp. AJS327 TaxID=2545265 RepID=UPI0015E05CB8|nr:caspase family protein [Streptomyces sp. AJS327]